MTDDKGVRVPDRLGSYKLLELLGRGGMGEVWRAEHLTLARPAAIKVIRPEALGASDEEARAALLRRFEREARATAALTSPHTIALHDFGRGPDGTFFYAMELLNGLDLESLVKRFGPVPPERVIHLLAQACDSLAEAHEHGLIHRDIKPANLYACRQGLTADFLKVLDFGLVKPVSLDGPEISNLTATHATTGTPAYMAPEVALGQTPIDARVDLYGLGCVAYFLLTGARVFEADSPMRIVLHHVQSAPPPPSSRTELPIPAELEVLILRCLEKFPQDRPESAPALREELLAVPLAEPWTAQRATRWWQTHLPERWARSAAVPLKSTVGTSAEIGAEQTPGPPSAMRASASEAAVRGLPAELAKTRETVERQLRNNFAHSTIDMDEYEKRVEQAQRARTEAALHALVRDLPPVDSAGHIDLPQPPPGPLVPVKPGEPLKIRPLEGALVSTRRQSERAIAILGGATRRGRWRPARTVKALAFMGGVDLDFREADLLPGLTEVKVLAWMGGVDIIVPLDLPCEVEGVGVMGGFDAIHVETASGDPEQTRLRITGVAFMGGVSVRGKARKGE